mmetsp:Transcript_33426/g.31901  ORF Transcript_33426/g.31901 Transcript_33426/m.31901 type:complete len:281 (-) Transcript_33426:1824-2666(-)
MEKFLTSNVKLNQGIKDNSKKKEVSSSSQVNSNQSRGGHNLLSLLQDNSKENEVSSSSQVISNQSRGGHDLLSLLQAAGRDDEKKQDEDVWNSDSQRNSTYSINDIGMNNKIAGKKKKTGWNLVDGKKTYTTYRNGGIVQGQGAEAFKLSMGDSKPTKSKGKESETEGNQKSTNTNGSNTTITSSNIKIGGNGNTTVASSFGITSLGGSHGGNSNTKDATRGTSKIVSTKENRQPKRTNNIATNSNNEFNDRNREDTSKKAKLCNFENLPGNSQFDFSFA